jgi:hypothetical protein
MRHWTMWFYWFFFLYCILDVQIGRIIVFPILQLFSYIQIWCVHKYYVQIRLKNKKVVIEVH